MFAPEPPLCEATSCLHCALPLEGEAGSFCCAGCEAVYHLIHEQKLDRYYELRNGAGVPVTTRISADRVWLEALEGELAGAEGPRRISMDVQGVHCAGCVWLIQRLVDEQPGALSVLVNPAVGRLDLAVEPSFDARSFADTIESFGYLLGPPRKVGERQSDRLLWRTIVCLAIAGNAMLLSAAIYFGLSEGPLHEIVSAALFALGAGAVLVGGPVFFRPAWRGLRRRMLTFDLPISIGILLAFGGSSLALWTAHASGVYLDTVTVFVALMLAGRWLQARVIERNRERLLGDGGASSILTRRVRGDAVSLVPCTELRAGDELLIARGDLVPVDATLIDEPSAHFSLDWISGESAPRRFSAAERISAGAFNVSDGALRLRAETSFSDSPLVDLLRSPTGAEPSAGGLPDRIAAVYVALVLAAAAIGAGAWLLAGAGAARSLEVATAVLVVTCPCAFGLAAPLAHELVRAQLRRIGLYVRTAGFFDRATQIRRLVFDKTGTLTTGTLRLANPEVIDDLDESARHALYQLSVRSSHPASAAIREALADRGLAIGSVKVREVPGSGIEGVIDGATYRLGSPAWAGGASGASAVFSRNGSCLARFTMGEELRDGAAAEVERLQGDGYDLWILSGDGPGRVRRAARDLGIAETHTCGDMSPRDKQRWLRDRDCGDTLFIGDGINDSLAAQSATCAGTPAVDRPFMASRSDFYVVTPGLGPIRAALIASRRLAQVVRRSLVFAVGYNIAAVGLAWAGLMQPWLAAVLMPASSIAIITATTLALARRPAWRS